MGSCLSRAVAPNSDEITICVTENQHTGDKTDNDIGDTTAGGGDVKDTTVIERDAEDTTAVGSDDEIRVGSEQCHSPVSVVYTRDDQPGSSPKNRQKIYTDGSYRDGNAGFGVFYGDGDKRNVSASLSRVYRRCEFTSQKAEFVAIQWALREIAREIRVNPEKKLWYEIFTDYPYALMCVYYLLKKWERNGWKNHLGFPLANEYLIKDIWSLHRSINCDEERVVLSYVIGHLGVYGNTRADQLASQGAGYS